MLKSGFALQLFICLLGLFILGIGISLLLRTRVSRLWSFSVIGVGLISIFVSFVLGYVREFQCSSIVPDRIKIVGHVKDHTNSYLNNYLVILYRENDEVKRAITTNGKFNGDRNDRPEDGYFELDVPNIDQLSRCSLIEDFRQVRSGASPQSLGTQTAYVWRDFPDLRTGISTPINREEGKKKYTLLVLPASLDDYPEEIKRYNTYLDQNGNIVINMPIKSFASTGSNVVEYPTGYFVKAYPLLEIPNPTAMEVRDAWVTEGSTREITGIEKADDGTTGIDNCKQRSPRNVSIKGSIIYIHEVEFAGDTYFSYDLGDAALKAAPSLRFMQGQVEIKEAMENVEVPAETYMKYKFSWQEVWQNGEITADIGQRTVQLPYRARSDMIWRLDGYPVDCP
jgi:hypothetical protein